MTQVRVDNGHGNDVCFVVNYIDWSSDVDLVKLNLCFTMVLLLVAGIFLYIGI